MRRPTIYILAVVTLLVACTDEQDSEELAVLFPFDVAHVPTGIEVTPILTEQENARVELDEKLWATPRDCKLETISWSVKQGPFEIVEKPSAPSEFAVLDWIKGRQTSPPVYQIMAFLPHPKHQAGFGSEGPFAQWLIFAEPGDDVQFSLYHWSATYRGKRGELGLTALVNYEATNATYTQWNETRTEIVREIEDTGFYIERKSPIHGIDLRIPASAFPEPGAYNITIVQKNQVDHRREIGSTLSFTLLYGGYSFKKTICVRDALNEPITEFERHVAERGDWLMGAFERDSLSVSRAMSAPDGGVWINWSLYRLWFDQPRIVAIVPMVDFRPVGPPQYTWSGGFDGHEEILETVDDRGQFWIDLEGYEKKDVMIGAFPDAFLPQRNLEGDIFYEVGRYDGRHSRVISISSYRDDSDKCDALAGPCED
jgi:hypothetical protein